MHRLASLLAASGLVLGLSTATVRADDTGLCVSQSGDETITACSRLIASNKTKGSDLFFLYKIRADVRQDKGDLDGAIADYDQAIRLNPKEPLAYNNRADARTAKGDLDGAIADYDQIIQLEPTDSGAFLRRGDVRRRKGDLDGAIADYASTSQTNSLPPCQYPKSLTGRSSTPAAIATSAPNNGRVLKPI
jgi:tetratricopeptide (TPR) repeat protein